MQRRDFIKGLAATAWPTVASAQQKPVRRIGILFGGFSDADPEPRARVDAFRRQLADLGLVEGRDIRVDLRIGAGDATRIQSYSDELVGMAPDMLAANSTPATVALARRTKTIPIVFVNVFDPVGSGLVANLAHPGGNLTGLLSFEPGMAGKWLELLKEVAPETRRVLVLFDRSNETFGNYFRATNELAPSLRLQCVSGAVANADDIDSIISSFAREPGGGMIAVGTVVSANREKIVGLAQHYQLPTVYTFGYFPRMGGLMSYGVDSVDLWRRAAVYAERVLKGVKPDDLPVQSPLKFELVINLKTARILKYAVPSSLVATADEVIE